MMESELNVLVTVLPSIVEWAKVEEGIAVRPVNQPSLQSVIKMPAEVRDKVWEWLRNPRVAEDEEEWRRLRTPIISVYLEIAKIIVHYGHPIHQEAFKRAIKTLSRFDERCL